LSTGRPGQGAQSNENTDLALSRLKDFGPRPEFFQLYDLLEIELRVDDNLSRLIDVGDAISLGFGYSTNPGLHLGQIGEHRLLLEQPMHQVQVMNRLHLRIAHDSLVDLRIHPPAWPDHE
jgi:hypothetical protein